MFVRGRHNPRRASTWRPTDLPGCVLWLDMLETDSYVITPGAGGALPTIQDIKNLVSGVSWTEATNPPIYEARGLGGRPCMRGDGVARRLFSTEAAVVSPFVGDDRPFTVALAFEGLDFSNSIVPFALSSSVTNNAAIQVQQSNGRYSIQRRDDALVSGGGTISRIYQPAPRIVTWRYSAPNAECFVDDETTGALVALADIGTITPTRAGLFGMPDVVPSDFVDCRIGAVVLFPSALSDADCQVLRTWLASRWVVGLTKPSNIPNSTSWCEDRMFTSGGVSVTQWSSSPGSGSFSPPAGKEPNINFTKLPSIDFVPANSDCLVNDTAMATGAITVGIKFKLDALPALGSSFMLASPRMGADKWFHISVHNQQSGWNDISFGFQNGLVSQQHFGIDGVTLDGGVHSLVVTYDGAGTSASDYRAWLDGVEVTVTASGTKSRTTGDRGSLGAQVSSTDVPANILDGRLLKFVTHDRALTDVEVGQLNLYLADGWTFSPTILPNLRLHLDLQDTSSYVVTAGAPPTVQSIRNKASGTLWTEATNPPEFVADVGNGYPGIKGDASARRLISTEAAVFGALDGDDAAFTIYAVAKANTVDANQIWFGAANSTLAGRALQLRQGTGGDGEMSLRKQDDAAASVSVLKLHAPVPIPHVIAFSAPGTTVDGYLNDGRDTNVTGAAFNVGAVTFDRCALFCHADASPDTFSDVTLQELMLFEAAHSEADVRAVARYLQAKWGLGFNPLTIPGLVGWFDMQNAASYTTSGGEVTSIRNLVWNTLWNTAATNFPLFEATGFNGLPCMRGDGARGIVSTDPSVVAPFAVTDGPVTVIAVAGFDIVGVNTQSVLGAGNSAVANNGTWRFGKTSSTPRPFVNKRDDAGVEVTANSATGLASENHAVAFAVAGTAAAIYVDNGAADPAGGALDVGATTPNRVGLLCRPDSAPDNFWSGKLAELLIFNRALTDLERTRVVSALMSKWGVT